MFRVKACGAFVQPPHGRARAATRARGRVFQVWHVGGVGCCTHGCAHRVRPCPGGLGYPFEAHRGFAQVSLVLSHSPVFLHDNPSAVRPRTYNHDSPCFLQFYSKNRPGKLTRHCASCLVHVFGSCWPKQESWFAIKLPHQKFGCCCCLCACRVFVQHKPAECLSSAKPAGVCSTQHLQSVRCVPGRNQQLAGARQRNRCVFETVLDAWVGWD